MKQISYASVVQSLTYAQICTKLDIALEMKQIPYASAVGSLMYAQVCTRPDMAYVVSMVGRFQLNSCLNTWKLLRKWDI